MNRYPFPYISVGLLFLLIFSCVPEKDKNIGSSPFDPEALALKKREIMGILHGGWLSRDYMNKVRQTNSVFQAYNEGREHAELIIDTTRASLDTIVNPGCYTNDTEGNYFEILFKNDSVGNIRLQLKYLPDYSGGGEYFLDYKISSKDTVLTLTHYDSLSEQYLDKKDYDRIYINPPGNDYHFNPMEYFNEEVLFRGKYRMVDRKDAFVSEVQFKFKEVSGFAGFSSYHIGHYFNSIDPQDYNFDYVRFFENGKTTDFHWVKKKDRIELYEIETRNGRHEVGSIKYTLLNQ